MESLRWSVSRRFRIVASYRAVSAAIDSWLLVLELVNAAGHPQLFIMEALPVLSLPLAVGTRRAAEELPGAGRCERGVAFGAGSRSHTCPW